MTVFADIGVRRSLDAHFYGFLEKSSPALLESTISVDFERSKFMKTNNDTNGPAIANARVPVMYRLLEIPASPQKSRRSARVSAQEQSALERP
jgi:hypothetical protein